MAIPQSSNLPTVIIIGAAKCGTTSLYAHLDSHPRVYVPSHKEPSFFAFPTCPPSYTGPGDETINGSVVCNRADYEKLFSSRAARDALHTVDGSTLYLSISGSASRIRAAIPDAQIIAMLRNPVERAYSAYKHLVRDGLEDAPSFEDALEREESRIRQGWSPLWHLRRSGMYAGQLEPYFECFPEDQIFVGIFEELVRNPPEFLAELCAFLRLDFRNLSHQLPVRNPSGIPRSAMLHRWLNRSSPIRRQLKEFLPTSAQAGLSYLKRLNLRDPAPMCYETRTKLLSSFQSEIQRVGQLIHRDLFEIWK